MLSVFFTMRMIIMRIFRFFIMKFNSISAQHDTDTGLIGSGKGAPVTYTRRINVKDRIEITS